jgi:hypothetical protein
MRPGRTLRVMAMMVGGGVIAAACSSNTPDTTTTTTTVHRTTTTTGPPASTSSTTTTTGIAACAQVSVTPGQTQGAAGTIIGTVTVAEVGSGTCTVDGYPDLTRYAGGSIVTTTVVHGLTMDLSGPQGQPPSLVTLTSTQQAEFTYQYSDVVTGSETSCAVSSTVSVTTPGATSASAPVPLSISACNNGTVDVSPLYASTG